jgi:DNA-binding NarL/FixJ family response regulator
MITVGIVDDHELIRGGLRGALSQEEGFTVVGEASGIRTALSLDAMLRPDVLLIDVNLNDPDGDGLELVSRIRSHRPEVGLVMLTMLEDDALLLRALTSGASGYVLKTAPTAEVLAAVRHAATSPRSFSATGLAAALARSHGKVNEPLLSDREQDVLERLATGQPIATIARQMFLSISTLKSHVSHVYEKLGARTRTEAILEAIRLGLIEVSTKPVVLPEQRRPLTGGPVPR